MSENQVIAEHAVRFVRILPAPAAKVWRFLTDTSALAQWYGQGTIEPREGGAVNVMGGHVRGVVTGWRPHGFFAHTWNVMAPGETVSRFPISYLEFALAEQDGATRLTLTHRPVPVEMQPQTAMGWHTMLDLIAAGLDGQFPDRSAMMTRNAARYGVDLNKIER